MLAALVGLALHFGDLAVFMSNLKSADPFWLAAAGVCQVATYACAAAVWFRVLTRGNAGQSFAGLFRLAIVQLFANQALPSGGASGTVIAAHGLVRRGVSPSLAMTALMVDGFSYYASYLFVGMSALLILWRSRYLGAAWLTLAIVIVTVLVALAAAAFVVIRWQGRIVPKAVRAWAPAAWIAALLASARTDVVRDRRLVLEAFLLQVGIFLLDAATLWMVARSVGLMVKPVNAFLSFVLASGVATLSPIPLGLGTFEGTCTGLLHITGSTLEGSLAATLILRGFTLWLPMLPGLWLMRRETRESHYSPPQGTEAEAQVRKSLDALIR
jgi:uncharacterized protein (TIRG00374 family)